MPCIVIAPLLRSDNCEAVAAFSLGSGLRALASKPQPQVSSAARNSPPRFGGVAAKSRRRAAVVPHQPRATPTLAKARFAYPRLNASTAAPLFQWNLGEPQVRRISYFCIFLSSCIFLKRSSTFCWASDWTARA